MIKATVGFFYSRMDSKKLFTLLIYMVLSAAAHAQTADTTLTRIEQITQKVIDLRHKIRAKADSNRYVRFADSLLDQRDLRARRKYDTLYIAKPSERWTVKARINVSGNDLLTRGYAGGQPTEAKLKADHKATVSFAVGYRGLTLGVALNPMKWAGKSKDFEYNLASYGNKFGFDAVYTSANTFRGDYSRGSREVDINEGDVRQQLASLSAYYAFNSRRFSYSAAFSQSQIQLRSAGSWLLAASLVGCKLEDKTAGQGAFNASKLEYVNAGLGGGYGYNLVAGRWLLHGSVTSELVVISYSRMKSDDGDARMPYRFPRFIVQGRMAALYSWRKSFAGLTGVCHFSNMGDDDQLSLNSVKWRVRAFYGFRF